MLAFMARRLAVSIPTLLLISLLVWGGALASGRAAGARPLLFALLGLAMWYFMLKSGIHSTIAGVLMALAVPLRHRMSAPNWKIRAPARSRLSSCSPSREKSAA